MSNFRSGITLQITVPTSHSHPQSRKIVRDEKSYLKNITPAPIGTGVFVYEIVTLVKAYIPKGTSASTAASAGAAASAVSVFFASSNSTDWTSRLVK